MKLYHASNRIIDKLEFQEQRRDEAHANGALGIFTDLRDAPYLRGFGPYIHEITLYPGTVSIILELRRLTELAHRWAKEEEYVAWRKQLVSQGYGYVMFREKNGVPSQAVIVDLTCVKSIKCIESPHPSQRESLGSGFGGPTDP